MKYPIMILSACLMAAIVSAQELGRVDSVAVIPGAVVRVDTVFVVRENHLSTVVQEMKGIKQRIEKSRRQGYGGGGGWTPMVMAVDMKPVQELLLKDEQLRDWSFDMGRVGVMTGSGGLGYGGIGNGLRIGGCGYGGERRYVSEIKNDSVTRLTASVDYGGVLIEKAFVKEKLNYLLGGMVGGGSYTVAKTTYKQSEPSAFNSNDQSRSLKGDETATASFTALELHAGVTYSLLPWFHVGGDASMTAFMGMNGFNDITDSFFAGSGAFRVRLIWGNLG